MTCTNGCNYSLCTPDDGCGRHPKHVECLGSKINKYCLELHLVACLKHRFMVHGNMNIKFTDLEYSWIELPGLLSSTTMFLVFLSPVLSISKHHYYFMLEGPSICSLIMISAIIFAIRLLWFLSFQIHSPKYIWSKTQISLMTKNSCISCWIN